MILWRISNHRSLVGDGALRTPGRWHSRGRRVVYLARNPAAALLEILVHLELELLDLPARYRLMKIDAPDDVEFESVSLDSLPADWPNRTDMTRSIGDTWLIRCNTALLTVPSVIVPETDNVLLNPAHRDAERIEITQVSEHAIDPRLLR